MTTPAEDVGGKSRLLPYLRDTQEWTLREIRRLVPEDSEHTGGLYELMLDYPLRGGKGLRPAIAIATCRALGGSLRGVLPSAAVLELYHNAFLVHDDVEDGSEKRRQEETLHRLHGVPIAVNVGDGMLALTLEPLLANMELLGMGRALRILEEIARMSRESAEGQMIELDWIRRVAWGLSDDAYIRMVHKKSAWYSFIAPMAVGAIAAGADGRLVDRLRLFASLLGVAFQIQDDVLNLTGDESDYGKEIGGDLWEGKHTLILIHALREADEADRANALEILARNPESRGATNPLRSSLGNALDELERYGQLGFAARQRLRGLLAESAGGQRSPEDVRFLERLIDRRGSIEYAWQEARRRATRAAGIFQDLSSEIDASEHRRFLEDVVEYVVLRDR